LTTKGKPKKIVALQFFIGVPNLIAVGKFTDATFSFYSHK